MQTFNSISNFSIDYSVWNIVTYAFSPDVVIVHRYLVTHLMGADLSNIIKTQKLTDEHVQFLVYQLLRGLKVRSCIHAFYLHLYLWFFICLQSCSFQ